MKEAKFNPQGGPLIANVKMTGIVFISYQIMFWSVKNPDRKLLIDDKGNNEQSHDDNFLLQNPDNPREPLIAHEDRIIHIESIITSPDSSGTPFKITLEIYQDTDGSGMTHSNLIETEPFGPEDLKLDDGDKFVALRIKLKSL